jgi:hypothetical protein
MDAEQNIAEIEQLERLFEVPDTRPLSTSDSLGCESEARREASKQPVVPAVAEVWCLLPSRVSSAPARRNRP